MQVIISRGRAVKLLAAGKVASWQSSDTGGELAPGPYVVLQLAAGGEHVVFVALDTLQREVADYQRKQAEIEQRKAAMI